ncbi:MAG: choice-of-anchor tandem repeat GloVer-containing protein [Terriglobales bacterium]
MHSTAVWSDAKGSLNTPDVGLRLRTVNLTLSVLFTLLLTTSQPAQAQTETVLYNFSGGSGGADPGVGLTSDGAGNFYGSTNAGGLGYGTVFELSPNGSGGWNETVLYSFTGGSDGASPGYVITDRLGNLYGTTELGGAYEGSNGFGVVFELSFVEGEWTETVLHTFAGGTDGQYPSNALAIDPAGNLYGTTYYGGSGGGYGNGTVFEVSPSGDGWTEQVIYNKATLDGYGWLTMDAAGKIFVVGDAVAFELTPNGDGGWTQSVIHTFTGAPKDGSAANGIPVLDNAGNLYGTTQEGGAKNLGTVYELRPGKKGKWTQKILYSFKGGKKDGSGPWAGPVLDAFGNIYGTTLAGGLNGPPGDGTVFELVAPLGKGSYKERVLSDFNVQDGYLPYGSLTLDSAGNLYGTTYYGGHCCYSGVVFEVTP